MTYVNEASWHYRIEQLIKQLSAGQGGLADNLTQIELLRSLTGQTEALSILLQAQSDLLQAQSGLLQDLLTSNEELKSSYSETLVLVSDTTGARIIKPPAMPSQYGTFQLISLDARYSSDATGGDRYLTLERVMPDIPANNKLELLHGDRLLGGAWQNGTLPPNHTRNQTWCQDAWSDNYSRTSIPLLSLNNAAGQSWRLRSIDVPGVGDSCYAVWTFRVFRSGTP